MCSYSFIEWDNIVGGFKQVNTQLTSPQHPSSVTWWSSTSNNPSRASVVEVTHLGDRASAEYRARANLRWNAPPLGLFELSFPASLSVLNEIYIENDGEPAMEAFAKKLLGSDADAAFYWNEKESETGTWSLVVRRSYLGELGILAVGNDHILSSLSPGAITPGQNATLPRITWV